MEVGIGDAADLASGGEFPGLTIDAFDGCLTVDGKDICAKYSGSIESDGIVLTKCDISTSGVSCDCKICEENNNSVIFECKAFPELTTNGNCVSPALIF